MQKIIIIVLLLCNVAAYAQSNPCTNPDEILICVTNFQYDAAGNRTARQEICACGVPQNRPAMRTKIAASPDPSRGGETEGASTATAPPSGELEGVRSGEAILRIFPNPTSSTITVEFTAATTGTLRVSDAMGKQLGSFAVSGNTVTVDISAYPAGTYLLTLIANDRIDTQRVVKADN